MHRPTVFLIGGFARAGKDTLASRIAELTGARKVAFADDLKAAANRFFTALGIESVDLNDEHHKARFRDLLVAAGKAARSVNPDIFAKHAADRARYNVLAGRCVVIPDWRYANEAAVTDRIVAPARVVKVLIERTNGGPANDEEAATIRGILDDVTIDEARIFDSGDLSGIDTFAHELVDKYVPQVPAAR
jgi:hypothetical protein